MNIYKKITQVIPLIYFMGDAMKLNVREFAKLKELTKASLITLDLNINAAATVSDLLKVLPFCNVLAK